MNKVAIFGVPRSGTSWLSQIFNSHPDVAMRFQPLFSYAYKGYLSSMSKKADILQFFDDIYCTVDDFILMASETQKDYPRFNKSSNLTHIVFKETRYLNIIENILKNAPEVKIIGVVRNPLAVISSWMLAPKEFDANWSIEKEWRYAERKNKGHEYEFYGFDKWKSSTSEFLKFQQQFPQQFRIVRYNNLNLDPSSVINDLFDFCALEYKDQVSEFIKSSKSRHDDDPYSVFRSKANDLSWKKNVPVEIIESVITELSNTKLSMFLED